MTATDHAIEKLTRPWSDVLSPKETGLPNYTPIDYPPMLDMLDDACRASIGERGSGSSEAASRILIDVAAHSLREQIDGTVRAWVARLSKGKAEPDLKAAIVQLAGILQAHHAAGTIPDSEHGRIMAFFPRWCARIWDLYDPPVVKELTGACPNPDCEQTHWSDTDGQVSAALIAYYQRGTERVSARCRACTWEWDHHTIRTLGMHLGATQDVEFLEAVGL